MTNVATQSLAASLKDLRAGRNAAELKALAALGRGDLEAAERWEGRAMRLDAKIAKAGV